MVSELTPSVPDSAGLGKRKKVASSKKLASSPHRRGKRPATSAARPSPRDRAIIAAGAIVGDVRQPRERQGVRPVQAGGHVQGGHAEDEGGVGGGLTSRAGRG